MAAACFGCKTLAGQLGESDVPKQHSDYGRLICIGPKAHSWSALYNACAGVLTGNYVTLCNELRAQAYMCRYCLRCYSSRHGLTILGLLLGETSSEGSKPCQQSCQRLR